MWASQTAFVPIHATEGWEISSLPVPQAASKPDPRSSTDADAVPSAKPGVAIAAAPAAPGAIAGTLSCIPMTLQFASVVALPSCMNEVEGTRGMKMKDISNCNIH